MYTLCTNRVVQINGVYAIYPTYVIPTKEVNAESQERFVYDTVQQDCAPLSSVPYLSLFRLLRGLFHSNEADDVSSYFYYEHRIFCSQMMSRILVLPGKSASLVFNGWLFL